MKTGYAKKLFKPVVNNSQLTASQVNFHAFQYTKVAINTILRDSFPPIFQILLFFQAFFQGNQYTQATFPRILPNKTIVAIVAGSEYGSMLPIPAELDKYFHEIHS